MRWWFFSTVMYSLEMPSYPVHWVWVCEIDRSKDWKNVLATEKMVKGLREAMPSPPPHRETASEQTVF